MTVVFYKFETDEEVKRHIFKENDIIGDLIPSSDVYGWLITHKGKRLNPDTLLKKVYSNTALDNPINIRECDVYVSIDGSEPSPEPFRYFDKVQSLYDKKVYLVAFNGTVLMGNEMLSDFSTDSHNPLGVRERRRYIVLPKGISVDLYLCKTAQNIIDKFNTKDEYTVLLDKQPVYPPDVELDIVIMKGKKVEILKKKDKKGIHFSLASACTSTASSREKVFNQTKEHELYTNWFAMSLYNCMEYGEDSLKLAKTVQQILKHNLCTELRVSENEESHTSLLSTAFDCFVQKNNHCCLHQCTLYDDASKPDFYMVSLNEGIPQHPKLIADFKKSGDDSLLDDFDKAKAQSFHYCMAMVEGTNSNYPILTMPCTPEKFDLYLCIPDSTPRMVYIKIMEAKVDNTKDLALLFCRMRLGVKALKLDMFDKKCFTVMPTSELTFKDEEKLSRNRVFKHNMRVYKLYDGKTFGSPNLEVIKHLGNDYLGNMREEDLTDDGRIKMFSYDYLSVNENRPSTLKHFEPIIKDLDMLHSKGIVHSDVRLQNMLFLENGDAKIIDFDLANDVGTDYPTNYNGNLYGRHEDARAGKPRKIVHDRYSLFCILEMKVMFTCKQKQHINALQTNESPMASIFDNEQN